MDEPLLALVGVLGGFGVIVLSLVLVVLAFLSPFFWYGTNKRTKETSFKLDETNELLDQIRRELKLRNKREGR